MVRVTGSVVIEFFSVWQCGDSRNIAAPTQLHPASISRRMPVIAPTELAGLRASVDRVVHRPQLDAPPDRPFPFVYFITIHNDSPESVTIRGRKWVVTDREGQQIVVEGDGVVGKFPRIEPGGDFSYESYHAIGADSVAEGAFFGVTESGAPVFTRIPRFEMRVPAGQ